MVTFIACAILCTLLVFKPKLFVIAIILIFVIGGIIMLILEPGKALIFGAVGFAIILIYALIGKSDEKAKKEISEFVELVKDVDGKPTVAVVKKRSPKLGFKVKQLSYNYYFYQKKDPYLRTIRIGHAATTEYVDDSGLVPGGVEKTDKGMMVYDNIYSGYFDTAVIRLSDEVYQDFINNFEDSFKYETYKKVVGDRNIHYIKLFKPLSENLGYDEYCKISNFYVKRTAYEGILMSYTISDLVKLCSWFNSETLNPKEEIDKFQKLKEQGIITEEEFENKKKQLKSN